MKLIQSMLLASCIAASSAEALLITNIFDDFNRPDNDNLGVTPVGGYAWIENEYTNDGFRIINNKLQANHYPQLPRNSAMLNYSATNLVMEIDMNLVNLGYYNAGMMYRAAATNTCFINCSGDGYRVSLNQQDGYVDLEWGGLGNIILGTYYVPGGFQVGSNYHVKVVAEGSGHSIFLNDLQVISYSDPVASRVKSGFVGLGSYNTSSGWRLDNFVVGIPEPGTGLLFAIAVGLGLLARKRRTS